MNLVDIKISKFKGEYKSLKKELRNKWALIPDSNGVQDFDKLPTISDPIKLENEFNNLIDIINISDFDSEKAMFAMIEFDSKIKELKDFLNQKLNAENKKLDKKLSNSFDEISRLLYDMMEIVWPEEQLIDFCLEFFHQPLEKKLKELTESLKKLVISIDNNHGIGGDENEYIFFVEDEKEVYELIRDLSRKVQNSLKTIESIKRKDFVGFDSEVKESNELLSDLKDLFEKISGFDYEIMSDLYKLDYDDDFFKSEDTVIRKEEAAFLEKIVKPAHSLEIDFKAFERCNLHALDDRNREVPLDLPTSPIIFAGAVLAYLSRKAFRASKSQNINSDDFDYHLINENTPLVARNLLTETLHEIRADLQSLNGLLKRISEKTKEAMSIGLGVLGEIPVRNDSYPLPRTEEEENKGYELAPFLNRG